MAYLEIMQKMILRTDVGSRAILQTEMENENAEPKFKKDVH